MTHFVLLLALAAPSAHARWLTKSEAGSVVERFEIDVDVKRSGASVSNLVYQLRIQAEDAKASASKFAIDYNSATDTVDVLEAYTLNGKTKVPVEASGIEDRDAGESKDFDAVKIRSVVFPHVQIGSRLFIRYRIATAKPIVRDRWSDHFNFMPTMAVENLAYRVTSERPLFVETNDPAGFVRVRQRAPGRVELTLKREIPGGVQAEKDPYWHPARATELWVSTEKDFPTFFGGLGGDFQAVLAKDTPAKLKPWLKDAAKLKTTEEQAFFLLRQISENFRYFSDWRRHDGGLIPRSLAEIERTRYGDCKELSSLLAHLLRQLGVRADPALVRRGDNPWGHEPDFDVPAVGRFNHVITRVTRPDGRSWWLDPTNPVGALDPIADVRGRPTLVLEPAGPRLDRTPDARPADFRQTAEYVYEFGRGGAAAIRADLGFLGLGAARLANTLLLSPRAQVMSDLLDYAAESFEVREHRFLKEPKGSRRLEDINVALELDAAGVTYVAGKDQFFVLPDGFVNGPFFETANRESDLRLNDTPYLMTVSRRLKKTRLAQDAPAPCRIDAPWFKLERVVSTEGPDVWIRSTVELRRPALTRDELRSKAFATVQAEARACYARAGVLIAPRG